MSSDKSNSLDDIFSADLEKAIQAEELPAAPGLTKPLAEHELWRVVGYYAVFSRVHCVGCGSVHTAPEGIFVKRQHARNHCEHLQRVAFHMVISSGEKATHYMEKESAFCQNCLSAEWGAVQ